MADFVAEVAENDCEAPAAVFREAPSLSLLGGELTDWLENTGSCSTLIDARRRSGDQLRKSTQVLRDSRERELKLSPARPAQPQTTKPQNALEMGKQHLDALATAARLFESLGLGQLASDIAGILVQIARDISHRRIGTALHFERADIAVSL